MILFFTIFRLRYIIYADFSPRVFGATMLAAAVFAYYYAIFSLYDAPHTIFFAASDTFRASLSHVTTV